MKVHIQCCQKCFLHKNYNHQQYDFHNQFAKIAQYLQKKNGIQVLKNNKQFILNNYLSEKQKKKIYTGNISDQINFDLNSKGKPRIQSFQIYFKDLLIYSKLSQKLFPNKIYISNVIAVIQKIQETLYLKSILLKLGFHTVHQYIQYRLPQKFKDNKTIHYKEIYQILSHIDFIEPFRQKNQNLNNQANVIKISKKKRKNSQTFQCNINKYQQFFQPIEQQDQNSKVVTPHQLQQEEKQNQKKIKSKLLVKNKRSISKRKNSEQNSNLNMENIKISSSKRSSQNKDKLAPPKMVNFARRIRCKKFSTRYSNINQKTEIINNLVTKEYNKIKQSKYQYLSKEMDIQVQYQGSTNQFVLQPLTDSEQEQNQSQIGHIFKRYKKKLSNFSINHMSSVSQPNLFVSEQLNDKTQNSSKPSFNNSNGLNSMIISQFQSNKFKDLRPSILGGISQLEGSNQIFQPANIIESNQTTHLQIYKNNNQEVSCMSINIHSQNQMIQQVKNLVIEQENGDKNIRNFKQAKVENNQQLQQIKLQEFNKTEQVQEKNIVTEIKTQNNKQKYEEHNVNSIQTHFSQQKKQECYLTNKFQQKEQLKNLIEKVQTQQPIVHKSNENIMKAQIRVCLKWLIKNYQQIILCKFDNHNQSCIQFCIFNILSNKLQTLKISIEEVQFIKLNHYLADFQQTLINLMEKILFQTYDKNMLKIQHIQLHIVQKVLKTFFMFPTISMSTKKSKKIQKMIKSIFQSERQENIYDENQAEGGNSRNICKIIGVSRQNQIQCFQKIQVDHNDFSKSIFGSSQGKCLVYNFSSFCKKFQDVILWFTNPTYLFSVKSIQFQEQFKNQQTQNLSWYINMQIQNRNNEISHLFVSFSSSLKNQQYTTVKIWKQISILYQKKEYSETQNKNKIELIGQIRKKGDFFFQLDLNSSNYVCEITKDQGFKNQRLNICTYCNSIVKLNNSRFAALNQIDDSLEFQLINQERVGWTYQIISNIKI